MRAMRSLPVLAAFIGSVGASHSPAADPDTVRIREIYVPYSELSARAGDNPRGVVMTLDEYRALVILAVGNAKAAPPPLLPPIEAAVTSARYTGALDGKAVRFEARIKIRVAADGWVRCDLGPPLPQIGKVTVDGEPGWIIVEPAPFLPATPRRAHLLLRGKGEHECVIDFSLPAVEHEDRWTVEGPLAASAASRVEIDVPGWVEAHSDPPFLEVAASQGRSRLTLAAGSSGRFRIEWRTRKTAGETEAFLAAEHRAAYSPRRDNPVFTWSSAVTIARRKTDSLTFTEPPGTAAVRVEGPLVHAWERTAAGLRVVLNEAVLGEVSLTFSGVLDAAGDRFVLAPPALAGAYSNSGYLAVEEPMGARLVIEPPGNAVEVSPADASIREKGSTGSTPRLTRVFAFAGPEARVAVRLADLPARHESRAALTLRANEDRAVLDGLLHVTAREGRVWRLAASLPQPWRLVDLDEAAAPSGEKQRQASHGLRFEEVGPPENRSVRIELARALDPDQSIAIRFHLEHGTFGEERGWDRRTVDAALPAIAGTERSRTDLGVILPPSMDALMAELPGWKSLTPEESAAIGLGGAVAALTTRDAAPRIALTLVHRPVRGEYRLVTHVLALEKQIRVRADVRLVLVDRPIEEVVFRLPAAAGDNAVILGEGIKEVIASAAGGRRTARFSKPWLGVRQFRIEYEAPHAAGEESPVPVLEVEPAAAGGTFGGERFAVLQSRGPVEIEMRPGPGITPADVDEVPSFAEPWSGGRVLAAYRFRPSGSPGTLTTVVHERAPVLKSLARELSLTTVLGHEGISHTRADILLAYSQESHLRLRLPAGARCLGVSVNDVPARSVVRSGATPADISIPLPPQSYARISVAYERPDASAAAGSVAPASPLGPCGVWREEALVLPEMPVGETKWTVYYPDGHRFLVEGGNVRAVDARDQERWGSFLETFLARLLEGKPPRWSAFQGGEPLPPLASIPALDPGRIQDAGAQTSANRAVLSAREPARWEEGATVQLIPEGRKLEASKMGGGAVIELAYRSLRFERFARRSVFIGTILLGCSFWLSGRRRALWMLVIWGLLLGTALPALLDLRSPLVAVPFGEGLVVLAAAAGGLAGLSWLRARGRLRAAAAAGIIILPLLAAGEGMALPIDGVLIPYDPSLPFPAGEKNDKVFLPREKFLELWRLAHPDGAQPPEPVPADFVLGNASYELAADGETFRLAGTIAINVLTDRWVTLQLPLDAQITRAAIDGADVGVAQDRLQGNAEPIPFIELKGRGKRILEIEATGPVRRELGEHEVSCRVLAGAAATVHAVLPAGAQPALPEGTPQAIISKDEGGKTTSVIDIGGAGRLELSWSFPRREGQTDSQTASRSYSSLTLTPEGYAVERVERVRITGRPLTSLEYRVVGDWRITEVSGAGISEWSAAPAGERDGANRPGGLLLVHFVRPVSEADLRIRGRALVADGIKPLATLVLASAARQEAFVGLHHSARRRFAPQVLTGMLRASREDLLAAFPVPAEEIPDRIYHAYASGEGETIAAEAVASEATLVTDAVLLVNADRLAVTAKSRWTVTGPGPLREEIPLPEGWSVRSVKSGDLRSWEVMEAGGSRRLVVRFRNRATSATEVIWSLERTMASVADPLDVPPLRTLPTDGLVLRESTEWRVAASDELDLSIVAAERLSPANLERNEDWIHLPPGASYRFALRSARGEGAGTEPVLRLGASRRSSLLGAAVISLARLTEDFIHVNARVVFRARLAGRERFRLQLPPGVELVSLETLNQRSRDVEAGPEGVRIEVTLQSPVTGEHPIDVSYRAPRREGTPPGVLPIKVFDDGARLAEVDQFVAVLQTSATIITTPGSPGLLPVEAESLPYLPEGVSAASLKPVFRASQLDWSLSLEEKLIEVARGPAAVVEMAEITTAVGDDGITRTGAAYTVRNRGLQFLIVEMPEGSTLWGVSLNGKPVTVGETPSTAGASGTGRRLRIPIEHVGAASLDLEVAVQYEERPLSLPSLRGSALLTAPRVLDTQVVETVWNLRFPDGYSVTRSGGNLREVAASVLYAKKAGNLLEQLEKISKSAAESDSKRVREQAAREMTRLEQALGDNLAELTASNRGAFEASQASRIGQSEVEGQWAANDAVIQRSQKAQEGLRQAREERQKAQQAKAPPTREEQAFLDATGHLKRAWKGNAAPGGRAAPNGAAEPRETPRESFEGLLDVPFAAQIPPGATLPAGAEASSPAPIDAAGGLKPLPDPAGAGAAPGLEAPESRTRGIPYTFVNQGGDARLGIAFTRKDALPRAAALAALAVFAAAFWWARRRITWRPLLTPGSPVPPPRARP